MKTGNFESAWQRTQEIETLSGSDDIFSAASIIKSLDLLISVDSMPAHLGGALGVKVWTLLHTDADRRWMLDRPDSPWYPTMRLFRQKKKGKWEEVVEQVKEELRSSPNKPFATSSLSTSNTSPSMVRICRKYETGNGGLTHE